MSDNLDHFHMHKEIREQPEIFARLTVQHLRDNKLVFPEFANFTDQVKNIERVTFLGCGSSFNAGLFGNYVFEELTGLPCEYEFADEFISRKRVIEFGSTFVVISQSGQTRDVLEAVRCAREAGAFVIAITNGPNSEITGLAHVSLGLEAGAETAVAATKSFSATLIMEIMLALYVAQEQNVGGETALDLIKGFKSLADKAKRVLELEATISKAAIRLHEAEHLVVLGRKFNYPIAMEAAHKIKESAYLDAEGYPSEEFLHGPSAIIEPGFPVFMIVPEDSVYERNLAVAEEVSRIKAELTFISDREEFDLTPASSWCLPRTNEILMPVLNIIALQLFAFHLGVARGVDANKPRHIKKFIG